MKISRLQLFLLSLLVLLLFGQTPVLQAAVVAVGCDVAELIDALSNVSNGDTLELAAGCTYTLSDFSPADAQTGLPAIYVQLTINGNGATIERNNEMFPLGFRFFYIYPTANLTINDLTLSNKRYLVGNGGAIYNNAGVLTVNNSIFTDNRAMFGGAIHNGIGGTVTINNSIFVLNLADVGGALSNDWVMTVNNSTFSDNDADGSQAIFNRGNLTMANSTLSGGGGGIFNSGALANVSNSAFLGGSSVAIFNTFNGLMNVSNSTFSGNMGGALWNGNGGILTLTNSTLSANSTLYGGGGIRGDDIGLIRLGSNIIIGNEATVTGASDIYLNGNLVQFLGYNIIGDITDTPAVPTNTDQIGIPVSQLNLSPLADNGGPTQTMALGAGSIAIGAGNCSTLAGIPPITTDQRGVARKTPCDVGAYEVASQAPPPTQPPPSSGESSFGVASPVTALCTDIASLSRGVVTATGGIGNVQVNGQTGNTYCRLIARDGQFLTTPAEIGVQSVLNLGVLQAVDVAGLLTGGVSVIPFITPVEVCLRGSGEVLFLSAEGITRTPQRLVAEAAGGYQCVSVPNSGTVVLVGSLSNLPQQPVDMSSMLLDNCQVTTTDAPINLRAEPNTSAVVLAQLPYDLTLNATEYLRDWYRVIYQDGQGWVSADLVRTNGSCGG